MPRQNFNMATRVFVTMLLSVCFGILSLLPAKAVSPARPVSSPPSATVTAIDVAAAFKLIMAFVLPANSPGLVGDWAVEAPSLVRWRTPNIIMGPDQDYYSFSRTGKLGNWQVKELGPRAGVFAIQFIHSPIAMIPPALIREQLTKNHMTYTPVTCNQRGSLLKITQAGKQAGWLFADAMALVYFTLDTPPETKELEGNGIMGTSPTLCH